MNWIAVLVAALTAALILHLFWRGAGAPRSQWFYLLQIVPAAMLGHALARIGPDRLAAKPHLYAMQAGGLALAIVLPALWMVNRREGAAVRDGWRDSLAFVLAYLAMGAVFWALA